MRKQVCNIARTGDAILIEFIDGTTVVAYGDLRKPKLELGDITSEKYHFPDSGFNKVVGLGDYQETFATIGVNIVKLYFYRRSDKERFACLPK